MNLPHALDAEQAIIGALMLNPALIGQASLNAEDFYSTQTRESFKAICGLISESKDVTPPAIHYRTEDMGSPVLVSELTTMLRAAQGVYSLIDQVAIVKEKAVKRRLAKIAAVTQAGALNGEYSLDLISSAEEALSELRQSFGDKAGAFKSLKEIDTDSGKLYERLKRGDTMAIPTGFTQLDYCARGGIQPGEVWIIAALTGRGKSSWALAAARHQASLGVPVGFVSREMSDFENYTRLLCSAAQIPTWKIRPGMYSDTYDILNEWRASIAELPLYINSSTSTVKDLRSLTKEIVKAKGIRSLFVDYLQLLNADTNGSRALEVATVSRILKEIAMDNHIGVFALSQFNRLANNDRPELHHLAESGGIEKDASLVLILDMNDQKEGELTRHCTMRIAKHRNGSLMSLKYNYRGDTLTFEERV